MFVRVLANMAKVDLDKIAYKSVFTDVPDGEWYSKSVIWAYDNGITSGTTATTFSPNMSVTREQLAAFFYAYAAYKGYSLTGSADLSKFKDRGQISNWAVHYVQWAVAKGLISGVSANEIAPLMVATRSQIATITKNFNENLAK